MFIVSTIVSLVVFVPRSGLGAAKIGTDPV
jgi:hypothetical protein